MTYSIADDPSENLLGQLFALIKRKILVQVRDRKACLMDLLLPCVMIIGGLYITTLDLVSDSDSIRNLSAYDFPSQKFVHNAANFNQTNEDLETFFDNGFRSDIGSLWTSEETLDLNTTEHFFDQIKDMDAHLYNQSEASYGQFFVQ